jgi:hypothetical protein
MVSPAIQEFAYSLPLDNGLLVADITAGKPIDQTEVLSLAAAIQSIYISVALESRALGRIDACHQVWSEAAGLFSELCDSPDEGHDPQPEPVREFSKLETASIERAYRRL